MPGWNRMFLSFRRQWLVAREVIDWLEDGKMQG